MDYSRIMLFSDLDGTLFDDETKVPENNIAAIRRFCESGGFFGFSSGRMPANVEHYVRGIPVNAPCILYNGCAIYDWQKKKFLHKETLDTEIVEEFLRDILKIFPEVDIQLYPGDEICFVSPEETANQEFVALHRPCRFLKIEDVKRPWLKVLMMGEPKTLMKIRAAGEKGSNIGTFVTSRSDYLEILPLGVNKGTALKRIMKLPQLAGRISIAVGDFYNDMELLEYADIGVAPANALEEVKKIADWVGCDNNSGIIADCIEHMIPNSLGKF